jgi:hypothetical protein
MRSLIVVILVSCACALAGVAFGAPSEGSSESASPSLEPDTPPQPALTQRQIQALIDRYRHRTWRWQRVMSRPVTLKLARPPAEPHAKIRVWKQVAARTAYAAQHPPHARAWACIHRYEGSWSDSGAPYYGGLQMDLSFQRAYGRDLLARKGTADHWTPLEQMWVAERAYRAGRGFYAWPHTARFCGLI